jgi:dynein heavy chain
MSESGFVKRLVDFNKDAMSASVLKKLSKYIEDPSFTPDAVAKQSAAAKSLCMWVRAMDVYARVAKVKNLKTIERSFASFASVFPFLSSSRVDEESCSVDRQKSINERSLRWKGIFNLVHGVKRDDLQLALVLTFSALPRYFELKTFTLHEILRNRLLTKRRLANFQKSLQTPVMRALYTS